MQHLVCHPTVVEGDKEGSSSVAANDYFPFSNVVMPKEVGGHLCQQNDRPCATNISDQSIAEHFFYDIHGYRVWDDPHFKLQPPMKGPRG
jgi:hypothetical protein